MTCIVGIKTLQGVFIGGDSAATDNKGLQTFFPGKVFRHRDTDMVIGCSGSLRILQILRYKLCLPISQSEMDATEYLVTEFIDSVRDCLKPAGLGVKEDGSEKGVNCLIGFQGKLFKMLEDYSINESQDYEAVGSGCRIALGVLYTTSHLPAQERIEIALQASCHHDAYVRPPFCLETISQKQRKE